MTLKEKIVSIYPELSSYNFADADILLVNRSGTDEIDKWEHPTLAKPTEAQLAALD